jgi:hypothetical protein
VADVPVSVLLSFLPSKERKTGKTDGGMKTGKTHMVKAVV